MRPITKMSWLATASTCCRDMQKQRPEAFTIECVMRVRDAAALSGSTAFSTSRSFVQRLQVLMKQALANIRRSAL